MRKLTKSGVAPFRNQWLKDNGGLCDLCKEPITEPATDAVLDHCHKTGECRGVLHRGCNAALGKVENARAMNGLVDDDKFRKWCEAIPDYILNSRCDRIYPSHKTEREKKDLVNKRKRLARRKERLANVKKD